MSKNLIIVESPAKVKTIKKFLGRDYAVEASVGHVRDLPPRALGVDEETFEPEYRVIGGKEKIVNRLVDAASKADAVFLAPDPDREGEAIAWHVAELIKDKGANLKRIQFNEITARAVREALEHPRELNEDLFNSQQARRVLDRLVGYKVSPLLWKKVKSGISAGRVQSVALRLIVDREKERLAFVPEEYWVLKATLAGPTPPPFVTDLLKIDGKKAAVGNAEEAEAVEKTVRENPFKVASVTEKERKRTPAAALHHLDLAAGRQPPHGLLGQKDHERRPAPVRGRRARQPGHHRAHHLHAYRLRAHRRRRARRGQGIHPRDLRRKVLSAQGPRFQDQVLCTGRP